MLFPQAEAYALPAIGSDHCPILLSITPPWPKSNKEFKFEAFWLEDPENGELVKKFWNNQRGSGKESAHTIKELAAALSKWSKGRFSNASKQIAFLRGKLTSITNSTERAGSTGASRLIVEQIEKLWRQEETYWRMRSQIDWLKWGDKTTKLFHASTIQRRQRNRISLLKIDDHNWCRNPGELKNHISEFYYSLYDSVDPRNFQTVINVCPSIVGSDMNLPFIAPVTLEEVKNAFFQMGTSKAPSPDVFHGHFYHHHWELLQQDLWTMVRNFFATGTLYPALTRTFISLILKVSNPESISQFRPISLCNFNYKIISKVMANRLKPWLPNIITPEQSAFIWGKTNSG